MNDLKPILESLLFVAEEPLTVEKLNNILELADKSEIRSALEELREMLDNRDGGFHLREVAGGWQLRTRPEYHEWIKRMLQPSPQRLSRAALETLAIVAYKQPVIRADIEYIRGVDSGGVLRQLMERKLIRVLGRKEIPGRPLIYATTKLFLELFDLKDLKDLPSPKEIEELSGQTRNGAEVPVSSDSAEYETDVENGETEMTTEGSTEGIPGEDKTETPAENKVNPAGEDEATNPADLTESESLPTTSAESMEPTGEWIDPDSEKNSELTTEHVEEVDADIPDTPEKEYSIPDEEMAETPTGNEANPPGEDEATNRADAAESDSLPTTTPAGSTEPAGKWIDPDSEKDSGLNTEHVEEVDADIPDSPVHHEEEDNNLSY